MNTSDPTTPLSPPPALDRARRAELLAAELAAALDDALVALDPMTDSPPVQRGQAALERYDLHRIHYLNRYFPDSPALPAKA